MPAKKKSTAFNFERSLTDLNQLVEKMESGNLSLEDSLQSFEQGVKLIRDCQQALHKAEQKVQILSQQGQQTLKSFAVEEDADNE